MPPRRKGKGKNNDSAGVCGIPPFPKPGKEGAPAFVFGRGKARARMGHLPVTVKEDSA